MAQNTKIAEEQSKTATMMNLSDVVNILDDRGCVDKKQAHASPGGTVTWSSHGNEKATIVFPKDSPFAEDVVGVPASGSATKVVKGNALGSYKYTLVALEGSNDPEVIIR